MLARIIGLYHLVDGRFEVIWDSCPSTIYEGVKNEIGYDFFIGYPTRQIITDPKKYSFNLDDFFKP